MNYKNQIFLVMLGVVLGWFLHDFQAIEKETGRVAKEDITADSTEVPLHDMAKSKIINRDIRISGSVSRNKATNNHRDISAVAETDNRKAILSNAHSALQAGRVTEALFVLNEYLEINFNDVEFLKLKAEALARLHNYKAQINTLYAARSYAWEEAELGQIRRDIRASVRNYRDVMLSNKNHAGVVALYQTLVYLEPEYSPYFLDLATAQSANNQIDDARMSLQLIMHDARVGVQASQLLATLDAEETDNTVALVEQSYSIPLQRRGSHFVVDAVINDRTSLRLIIDTGASLTMIKPESLPSNSGHQTLHSFGTANGIVQAPVFTANSLTIGEFEVRDIRVGGLELVNMEGVDGLLGMNYLKHFRFFIDQKNSTLRLTLNNTP